ncbi:unnamed protein product, partial [Symbiodinium sp. CCMP2456]
AGKLTRSKFEQTVAALEFFSPGLKDAHVMGPTAAIRRFVLRLGANVGTKVQREQVTFLDWDKDVDISKLFLRLLRATPGEERLTIQGLDPTVTRRLGRWQSETSFQVYIDVVTALEVEVTYCARALDSDIRQAVEQLRKHFPLGCFNFESDESTTPGYKHAVSRRAFPISIQTTSFAQRRVSTQSFNASAHGSSSTSRLTRSPTSLG